MKNEHPIITATASSPVDRDSTSSSMATEPIIRLKLDKPLHWEWELTTSADALPVIQLLDKDGRLLVETTGRTAQRARGSFRDGLRTHEEFPRKETNKDSNKESSGKGSKESSVSKEEQPSSSTASPPPPQGNRNVDGFSTKFGTCEFGYRPRKSRSEQAVKEKRPTKRHSTGTESSAKENARDEAAMKRYSAGDYLRQQILDDLRTRTMAGKSPEEIAKDRYRKVKAYLRSQSDFLPRISHEEAEAAVVEEEEEGVRKKEAAFRQVADQRPRVNDAEQADDSLKRRRKKSHVRQTEVVPREQEDVTVESLPKVDEGSPKTRQSGNVDEAELSRIRAFLCEKIQQKMNQESLRSRSTSRIKDSTGLFGTGIRKRHSDYRHDEDRKHYRTRKVRSETNVIRFEPEVLEREREKSRHQQQQQQAGRVDKEKRTCKDSPEDRSQRQQRDYRRSRTQSLEPRAQLRPSSSSLERRKLYRKTRSDVLLGQIGDSIDSEKETNPPRRIKSQDNIERSWREYKERKRYERLQRGSEKDVAEEDFMSKPRWKDLQRDLCSVKNCKVCRNVEDCVDPLKSSSADHPPTPVGSSNSPDRPSTALQENYLLLDQGSAPSAKARSRGQSQPTNLNSPDFGYNSIPKSAFKDYRELYARSNVKKSDTFKIVDGTEEPEEDFADRPDPDENENVLEEDLDVEGLRCEGSLANKSNEDIARDYFKRVYELLKRRQLEARMVAEGLKVPGYEDSSSSNYVEEVEQRRYRRKKKNNGAQGEEIVAVPPTNGGQEAWKQQQQQRLSLTNDSPNNRRRPCRPQLQTVSGSKRTRPAPPPPPIVSAKVNAKDIGKYFDWPNKENTPGNAVNSQEGAEEEEEEEGGEGVEAEGLEEVSMGSNLSRHNGKGLTGRRTQSSGNLCEPKGKLNSMGKILVPCSSAQRERYKFCGSLPNHLDDKDALDDDPRENNNVMANTMTGNFGGTLPHKKRSLGVHFSDGGPTGTLDLVKHRSQDSLDENDPWRYQQSDLDLVRCRHGNFDSVRRNRSTDTVSGTETLRRYPRGTSLEDKCHRNSDLDLVGTLPKRKQESRSSGKSLETTTSSSSSSSQPCVSTDNPPDDDLLMRIIHKPNCELLKHRQQMNKCVDLKLSKLMGGEPQDQGYASERSPEDEHPPSLPGQPFPSVTPESTFRVTLQKSSRGLGLSVSGGGTAGPVRVKRLFPQQPAALSNKLQPGDILLAANGIPLTGLTNYEALEVLRTTPSTVELVVCRLPGDTSVSPPGAPPPPPARREPPPPLRILNPLPPLQIEPCGEFDIEMTKVGGSLGFTLRKADSSALGHYVRALVREPALSDGRIRPGDKIVAVDGAPLSPMSHEEAVALLRQCGPKVRLRLYRDLAQTPVSALSPTEPDHPLRPPRTSLRQEAVDMLCDLAVRKLSPGTSSGSSCKQSSGTSSNSPRRLRRLATRTTPTADSEQDVGETVPEGRATSTCSQAETSDSDQCSIRTQITNSQPNTPGTDIIDPPSLYDVCYASSDSSKQPARPSFLDLTAPQGKPHFQFCSLDSENEYPVIVAESEGSGRTEDYDERDVPSALASDEQDNDLPSEPASMPPVLSSTSSTSTAAFSYKNPAYQSANPACGTGIESAAKSKVTHSSDQDIPGKILGADDPAGSKGLLKWKGVMFAPNDEVEKNEDVQEEEKTGADTTDSAAVPIEEPEQENEVFMVELTRGWNSRLGFSLQPEGNRTVISVVHPDSVAAKDGRLKQGDVLMMVNDESVETMSTAEIIDLLRKIRGSIGITVMRRCKRENAPT